MKITKIENRITYFIITLVVFLLNIKNLSFLSLISGSLLSLLFILLFEKTNIRKFTITKFILLIISIFMMIISINQISSFISDNILREYSIISITFSLLLSIFILGNKGYHTIIKVILLATYFIFFITILGLLLNFPYVNISNLSFDILKTNNLFKETLYYTFLITYAYFLIYQISNTKFKIKDLLVSSSYQILLYLLIISILGSTLTNLYEYPYITIFKKVDLIDFVERVEIIFSLNYLFNFYFFLLLCYYQIRNILENKIKKDKNLKIVLILITSLVFLTSILIF